MENIQPYHYYLEPGHIFINPEQSVVMASLGSCVAVCLYDSKEKYGGMNHFVEPKSRRNEPATAKFGNAATVGLIRIMLKNGSDIRNIQAQIFGGAAPSFSREKTGRRNVKIVKKILKKYKIPIVSEDIGGNLVRRVAFNTQTGETMVHKGPRVAPAERFSERERFSYAQAHQGAGCR